MLIHLEVERLIRKFKDAKRKRWKFAAFEAMLAELHVLESHARSLRFDYLSHYPAFCGLALAYAKETEDTAERRKLFQTVVRALEVLKWLERVTIDRKRSVKLPPLIARINEILIEFDALPK